MSSSKANPQGQDFLVLRMFTSNKYLCSSFITGSMFSSAFHFNQGMVQDYGFEVSNGKGSSRTIQHPNKINCSTGVIDISWKNERGCADNVKTKPWKKPPKQLSLNSVSETHSTIMLRTSFRVH